MIAQKDAQILARFGDYHMHTTFCDGRQSAEQMLLAALAAGAKSIGFSAHAPVPYADTWHMPPENEAPYRAEVARLQALYGDRIALWCGTEADGETVADLSRYDYVIASMHTLFFGQERCVVDYSPAVSRETVQQHFGGDWYAYCSAYYRALAALPDRIRTDVIGHFDLCAKFNEADPCFDEEAPRYQAAAKEALLRLAQRNIPIEINTGAVFRGKRTVFYPRLSLLRFFAACGGRVVLCSDAHGTDAIAYAFADARDYCRAAGLTAACVFDGKEFVPRPL